jgi:hypothetical protein
MTHFVLLADLHETVLRQAIANIFVMPSEVLSSKYAEIWNEQSDNCNFDGVDYETDIQLEVATNILLYIPRPDSLA